MLQDLRIRHPMLRGAKLLLVLGLAGLAAAIGLLAARQPLIALGGEMVLLLALGILAWPDASTLVVVFILYSNAASIAVDLHGVPYAFGAAVPVLLIVPLASYLIFRREKLVITAAFPLFLLFLLVQVASTLLSRDIGIAIQHLVKFVVEGVVLYFLISNAVRTPKMARLAIWAMLLVGTCIGLLMFYQQITNNMKNIFWGFAQVSRAAFRTGDTSAGNDVYQARLAGMIGQNNYCAQVMLMLVPLGLFRFWGERSKLLKVLALVMTGCSALGMALTFSRGAALAFALMILIMTFMRYVKPYQVVIVALVVAVVLFLLPQYSTRLARLQGLEGLVSEGGGSGTTQLDASDANRANEMLTGLLVFIDHPVVGVGPGMFNAYYQEYSVFAGYRVLLTNRAAHDLYVDIGSETGALGLMCFLGIVFVTVRNLNRTRKRYLQSQPELANMATGFMLAIITYMTTGMFLSFAYERYFWLVLALGGAISHMAAQSAPDTSVQEQPGAR